jgi:hypothetical protein
MSEPYLIYQIEPDNEPTNRQAPDGVLRKNWYKIPGLGDCLFKEAKSADWIFNDDRDAKTDWTEKVVSEIAKLLKIPVAQYEFATGYFDGSVNIIEGILSVNCIPENSIVFTGEDLLLSNIDRYRSDNLADYTIENCLKSLELADVLPPENWQQPTGIVTGSELFVGYLMLDALCINRDRHYHNWGAVAIKNRIELIPSFDHGLSLGGTDNISFAVDRYAAQFKSPFQNNKQQQLSTLAALEVAAQFYPSTTRIWQEQLGQVDLTQITEILERIPPERITPAAAKFALDLIAHNQRRILELKIEPPERGIERKPPRRDRGGR